ncbi:hypothetical protein ACTFH7_13105 [Clostridium cagae]|uniref:hypothetical protein n=1 Tax=Clostridium cagae TaxID=2080751 RepID=UPI003F764C52
MGMIRARVSDEFEAKLNETVERVQNNTPTGAEANTSTIIRGAIEDFIQRIQEEEKGIKTLKIDVENLNNEQLEIIKIAFNKIASIEEKKEHKNITFKNQLLNIIYDVYRRDIENLE